MIIVEQASPFRESMDMSYYQSSGNDFNKALEENDMTDVVINCPDGQFGAHKTLLSLRSSVRLYASFGS